MVLNFPLYHLFNVKKMILQREKRRDRERGREKRREGGRERKTKREMGPNISVN